MSVPKCVAALAAELEAIAVGTTPATPADRAAAAHRLTRGTCEGDYLPPARRVYVDVALARYESAVADRIEASAHAALARVLGRDASAANPYSPTGKAAQAAQDAAHDLRERAASVGAMLRADLVERERAARAALPHERPTTRALFLASHETSGRESRALRPDLATERREVSQAERAATLASIEARTLAATLEETRRTARGKRGGTGEGRKARRAALQWK